MLFVLVVMMRDGDLIQSRIQLVLLKIDAGEEGMICPLCDTFIFIVLIILHIALLHFLNNKCFGIDFLGHYNKVQVTGLLVWKLMMTFKFCSNGLQNCRRL